MYRAEITMATGWLLLLVLLLLVVSSQTVDSKSTTDDDEAHKRYKQLRKDAQETRDPELLQLLRQHRRDQNTVGESAVISLNKDQSSLAKSKICVASLPNSLFVFVRWQHGTDRFATICSCVFWLWV